MFKSVWKSLGRFLLGLSVLSFSADALTIQKRNNPVFDYTTEIIRGVNIGGWLVLEPWITPSLFQQFEGQANVAVDEWTFCEFLGAEEAQKQLNEHWSTFYTYDDFARIAGWGVNVVRIPIGYWAFSVADYEPFVQGQEYWLDQAISWARSVGLKVWIDLHGAPGSQNGFDNSGKRGGIGWQKGDTVARTYRVISTIIQKYTQSAYADVVIGIETLNEPLAANLDLAWLKQYDRDAYNQISSLSSTVATVFHDGYISLSDWNEGLLDPSSYDLILDTHHYEVFSSGQCAMSFTDHLNSICNFGNSIASSPFLVVTGEWSAALDDCAKWLNGMDTGARYDGTFTNSYYVGTCNTDINNWTADFRSQVRQYIETQLDQYERGRGWFFWTAKTEKTAPGWDMGELVDNGIFPQPLTDRSFAAYCS
ncbi:glucan 1,3-beta-glucosidase I/II [Schizosaccharomyces japonicus yFS275]|uniref:glucan 1,3-beta-glucosidase n=1 Tax=Schizosaccharomyces japonicus (strain yFS275 / FY16936) TaxID=402676 RepID=B6K8C3_SCHJY|nr:glucan 1,3-beta-glucosidase I/II [Schizosaccharomyces japonicus yFS275]EEB09777.1 glucan 1,3-beta-glucosidase I/II [Schizosaccharomyces japonicus yFS275]